MFMLDINLIRNSPNLVKEDLKKRFKGDLIVLVDSILKYDKEWRRLKYEVDVSLFF